MDAISKTDKPTDREIFYFRQRNRNNIFQSVIAQFSHQAETGLTKRELARRLDKDPAQITRWFSGPANWTLDTVSDLLLAMGCEPSYNIAEINPPQNNNVLPFAERTSQTSTISNIQQFCA